MKTTHVPYVIKTNGAITMYLNGESATVATDHPNYAKVMDSLKTGNFDVLDSLVNIVKAIETYTSINAGDVKIENGVITYAGTPLNNTLTTRILKMMADGFKFDHMVKFLDNLLDNPSKRAVEELYTFLENSGLPITDDGCFLAYKAVRNDYKDIYSGKISNHIGATPEMPRNLVDEDYNTDCSHGLHVGALDYVTQYGHFTKGQAPVAGGNRLLIVKVNPANVVSVPKYETHPKMRVCTYLVVDEIKDVVRELEKIVYKSDGSELDADYEDDYNDADDTDQDTDEAQSGGTPADWDGVVDTKSPWNEEAYLEGYAIGTDDLENDDNYGESRDYSRENSYRVGYNDAYNERPNMTVAEDVTKTTGCSGNCPCGCGKVAQSAPVESADEIEYTHGYGIGERDAEQGSDYGHSLDDDDSPIFANGYSDGYSDYFNV